MTEETSFLGVFFRYVSVPGSGVCVCLSTVAHMQRRICLRGTGKNTIPYGTVLALLLLLDAVWERFCLGGACTPVCRANTRPPACCVRRLLLTNVYVREEKKSRPRAESPTLLLSALCVWDTPLSPRKPALSRSKKNSSLKAGSECAVRVPPYRRAPVRWGLLSQQRTR